MILAKFVSRVLYTAGMIGAFGTMAVAAPPPVTNSASSVSNSPSMSTTLVSNIVANIATSQTSSIISGAISSALTGGFSGGGFAPTGGAGGFTPTGGGLPSSNAAPTPDQVNSAFALNSRTTGKAGGSEAAVNGIWVQGQWSNVDKSTPGAALSGNIYSLMTGFDRQVTSELLLGVALGYERTELDTSYNSGTYDGDGATISPYIGYRLNDNWSTNLSIGYTRIGYDLTSNSGATTGAYDANRYFGSASVIGSYGFENWRFQPSAGLSYSREDWGSYTLSNNTVAEADSIALGQLTGGLKIGYAFDYVVPYAKLSTTWDFKRGESVTAADGSVLTADRGGASAGLGLEAYTGPFTSSVELGYTSLFRNELDVWTGLARLRYAF